MDIKENFEVASPPDDTKSDIDIAHRPHNTKITDIDHFKRCHPLYPRTIRGNAIAKCEMK